jgi:hypothetical protein
VTRKPLTAREQRFVESNEESSYYAACYGQIRERLGALRDEGFHFADLSPVFDQHSADDEVFLDSYHFGDRGNQPIAAAIAAVLEPILLSPAMDAGTHSSR